MFSHLLRWKGDSKYSIEFQSIPLEFSFKIQKDIIYEIIKGQKYYSSRNDILKTLNQEDIIVEALNERVLDLNDKFEYYIYQSFDNYLSLIEDELKQSVIIKRLNKVGEKFLKDSIIEEIGEKIKLENEEDFDAIKEIIKDLPEFVYQDTIKEIREEIDKQLLEVSTEENFIRACVSGIIFGIEESFSRFGFRLTSEQIESLFDNNSEFSEEVKAKILKSYIITNSEYRWILEKANEFENLELFAEIDRAIFNKIDESEYFLYWKDNLGRIFPENYLATYFDDNESKYLNIKEFNNKPELIKLLFSILSRITIVEDRKSFCTVRNLILSLHTLDSTIVQKILELNKPFYQLILWELGVVESFDFKLLKGKFIYFQPREQVKIVKKLFYLKQKGTIDLSLNTLQEFVLADIDIFKLNKKINPEIILVS